MIAHSMKVIKAAVQHLNPLQTPVITLDQSLYALAKQIQWTLPEFDEHKFSAMMGGLHIEMASLQMLGKWLTGCGWSEIMYSAGVATQGIAESFLTASHVTRTWRAHQVIVASLHILQKKKAYSAYKDKLEETETEVTTFSVLGTGLTFRAHLSTPCEGLQRSQLCTLCWCNPTDTTLAVCDGPHKLC